MLVLASVESVLERISVIDPEAMGCATSEAALVLVETHVQNFLLVGLLLSFRRHFLLSLYFLFNL